MKKLFIALMLLIMANPAFAVDTTKTYTSGLLVLLFLGFCALIIVAQLVPALLALFGMTRAITQHKSAKSVAVRR